MEKHLTNILTLPADTIPLALDAWLAEHETGAMLVSLERLPDGKIVMQALPGVDPALVAQIRRVLAQHADVLRRLT